MDKERNNLIVFGYGLALFIPFLVLLKLIEPEWTKLSFGVFLMVVTLLLFSISKVVTTKLFYGIYLVCIDLLILANWYAFGFGLTSAIFLGIAICILLVSIWKIDYLKPVYDKWMIVAHFIGNTISMVVMGILFYCLFAPIGIFLRIIQKDLLHRKIDKEAKSYWLQREPHEFDKERCRKQF